MKLKSPSLQKHFDLKGKIEVISRSKIESKEDLGLLYSPGVSEPCLEIEKDKSLAYTYTRKHNLIAVISDGSAVLGLGNIGPEAAMPVMEGKAILFKRFADVDAFPIVLDTQDTEEIIETIVRISKSFGGINLEDISAPRCFEIEKRLKELLDIPVFHDDQHGTAIVLAAALVNSLKLSNKKMSNVKIVINGAGAAGITITKFLIEIGAKHIIVCDKNGILSSLDKTLPPHHQDIARLTNPNHLTGSLEDAIKNSDVFIGVSAPHIVSKDMIKSMNKNPLVFPMANPVGEISYNDAIEAGALVVGTGSSNYPNQINNLLAFPGVFRGVLDYRKKQITTEMMIQAAYHIAHCISDDELRYDYILPSPLDPKVHKAVSQAMNLENKSNLKITPLKRYLTQISKFV